MTRDASADARLPDGWEMVIGLEVHCELATATKLFCSLRQPLRRRAQRQHLPHLPRPARLAAGAQRRGGGDGHAARARAAVRREALGVRPEELLLSGPGRRTTRSPSTTCPPTRTATSTCPSGLRVGITRAHIEEDTGKLTHVGGGGRIHDAGYSLVDYNRSGVPLVEIVSEPDIRTSEQAKEYAAELRAILLATERERRQDGGGLDARRRQRLRQPRRRAVGHPLRDQEPQLAALARPGHRPRGAAPDRPARERRARPPGDPPLGRGVGPHRHPPRRRRTPTTTATSPSPTSCRSTRPPTTSPRIDASLPPLPGRPPRHAGRRGRARADRRRAWCSPSQRDLDGLAVAAIAAGADADRVLTHVEHNLAVDGAESLSAEHLAALVAHGDRRRAHRHPGQDGARRGGRHRRRTRPTIAKEKGFEALDTGALEGIVDEVIAAHPEEWERVPHRRRQGPRQAHRLLHGQGDAGHARARPTARPPPRSSDPRRASEPPPHRRSIGGGRLRRLRCMAHASSSIHGAGGERASVLGPGRGGASAVAGRGTTPSRSDLPCDDDRGGLVGVRRRRSSRRSGTGGVISCSVAQSLGGFTAPLVAERVPVELIVLVTAMVPRPGRDRRRVVGQHRPPPRRSAALRPRPTTPTRSLVHDVPPMSPRGRRARTVDDDQSGDAHGPAVPARRPGATRCPPASCSAWTIGSSSPTIGPSSRALDLRSRPVDGVRSTAAILGEVQSTQRPARSLPTGAGRRPRP